MLSQKQIEAVNKKFALGIENYEEFKNSIDNSKIDVITVSKTIKNKKMLKGQTIIFELIKEFSFRNMKKSHIYEGGVLIFENATVLICKLNNFFVKYIAKIHNHYEIMEFKISSSINANVIITKTRLRKVSQSKFKLWIWRTKQKDKLQLILKYLSRHRVISNRKK